MTLVSYLRGIESISRNAMMDQIDLFGTWRTGPRHFITQHLGLYVYIYTRATQMRSMKEDNPEVCYLGVGETVEFV